jgi:AcrR family transcriptional regulator
MTAITARERVRAELTREITEVARRQLARSGAAGLSLRAVAREVGMASSAVYRYFPSRDVLLTALIVHSYDALGAEVEAAEARVDRTDLRGRWLAACRAVRRWALEHPHEYALIYGSPVPGYEAPKDTVAPASRVGSVLAAVVRDAFAAGRLRPPQEPGDPPAVLDPGVVELFGGHGTALWRVATARGVMAWTHLLGAVSFELFGHLEGVVGERAAYFDHAAGEMATFVGLPPDPASGEHPVR